MTPLVRLSVARPMPHEERVAQLRRIREAEARDPVENAYLAFLAVPPERRGEVAARFNAHQQARRSDERLTWTPDQPREAAA